MPTSTRRHPRENGDPEIFSLNSNFNIKFVLIFLDPHFREDDTECG
jgi:hypothetical protein